MSEIIASVVLMVAAVLGMILFLWLIPKIIDKLLVDRIPVWTLVHGRHESDQKLSSSKFDGTISQR